MVSQKERNEMENLQGAMSSVHFPDLLPGVGSANMDYVGMWVKHTSER